MPHCPSCGEDVQDADEFCRHCGSSLSSDAPPGGGTDSRKTPQTDSGDEDDPLARIRGHERELEAIAKSDAPDAPVAAVALALVRDEPVPDDALATLERGEVSGRA